MAPVLTISQPEAIPAAQHRRRNFGSPAEVSAAFGAAFGVPFSILDATSGDLLHRAPGQPARDWGLRGELARQVARRGTAEFVEAAGPLVTLAVPIATSLSSDYVAIATLLERTATNRPDELAQAADLLGLDLDETREWISQQTPCSSQTLGRIAVLVRERFESQQVLARLERNAEVLAGQLAANHEEVNLLYCLIQNLRISAAGDQLAQLALEWLGNVVPSEGLALLWTSDDVSSESPPTGPAALITRGACPFDNTGFAELMAQCERVAGEGPFLLNPAELPADACPIFGIRNLVAAPLVSSGRRFGWLAAINRVGLGEFRQFEANLFNSVATILGIHRENTDLFRDQAELVTGVVHALTSAIDAKDSFTSGHSDRVARISVRLGQQLGCDAEEQKTLYLAGLLHDVGKIGIDDDVLRKPGELTVEEYEHVKLHPRIGYQILADLKKFQPVLPAVLHHHEAWDGSGYPDGLAGTKIPRLARIVAVADAFDAMASQRPYRPGLPLEQLDATFRDGSGIQWDPEVVSALFAVQCDAIAILQATPQSKKLAAPGWT